MNELIGVVVGAGYFSQFHYEAWSRMPGVRIAACCDRAENKARGFAERFSIPRVYGDFRVMFDEVKPHFVDVVTPPATHLEICREAAQRGIDVICQKALAPSLEEAETLVRDVSDKARLMVHENFRFQPWHREIKRLLGAGAIGAKLHSVMCRSRPGDGWGEQAYLVRQPYFREMERFLIFETGIHFIDTFRFLAGEVRSVTAVLRRLNPLIAGEDAGLLMFEFDGGAIGLWDANRYNESTCDDPRYVFGEFLIEGDGGSIRLDMEGRMTIQPLGGKASPHEYTHERVGFAGDCVYAAQKHFIERLRDGRPFETDGRGYLVNVRIQEALYEADRTRRWIELPAG